MIDRIINELIVARALLHTNNVSKIAEEIGYRPLILFNALYRGEEQGKFVWNRKNDTIDVNHDVETDHLAVTETMGELQEQLEMLMGYMAKNETDMSIEEAMMLLGGTPQLHVRIAVHTSSKLAAYEVTDPKDKKSTYTFMTLRENVDKRWGEKQFDAKNSKVSKLARKAERKAAKQAQSEQ